MNSLFHFVLLGATLLCREVKARDHAQLQVEWLKENGGFFSPKMKFRLIDENDKDSPWGVFAVDDIKQGETLIVVPQACLLTSEGSRRMCDTARNLMKQKELGEKSNYAPYVNYVFDPKHANQLPVSWSTAGKKLIHKIVGRELPPYGVTDISFQDRCGGSGAAFEEEAWQIVVRRSWDDLMVPVFDMFNHRNGKWCNIDSNSAHAGEDIVVFASRDVKSGEQLYLSYNECKDCIDYAWTYVLPDIFKDYGFVEQYPRRWNIEGCAFELDENEDTGEIDIAFLTGKPKPFVKKFMHGQLKRLRGLQDYVTTEVPKLESEHERRTSLEYYNALIMALEYALIGADAVEEVCSIEDHDSKMCALREYDPLDSLPDKLEFNYDICDFGSAYQKDMYERIFQTDSLYQDMIFTYSSFRDDTCLTMNGHLHACASLRPHYHEVFVHYPARYVDEVKRVAFIGGGDNMIVHEILKYPSLELALGMELDQTVVRSSFKMFGTQPHFDDERLQWWFGDGSKTILMLPEEYYGTFDVVYVDLQNEVVDMLKVAGDIPITEAAMLLLKPEGVLARNEDWDFGSAKPFSKYTADLYYVDVPVFCYQQITMGSNAVDFLKHPQRDHGVETKYLKPVDEVEDSFEFWYNYRKTDNVNSTICKDPGMPDRILLSDEARSNHGILLLIEAEDVSVPLEDASDIQEMISKALGMAGLTEIAAQVIPDEDGFEIFVLMKEGYAIVRGYTNLRYCAFDLLFWSDISKQEKAKASLIEAVGSREVSSYRVLTTGMFGVGEGNETGGGPRISEPCQETVQSDDAAVGQIIVNTVLFESTSLLRDKSNLVIVLCGEESSPCGSLEVLKNSKYIGEVFPVWACPNLEDASLDAMLSCESKTLQNLQALDRKIDGVAIDSNAPSAMGRVLHKIFSSAKIRNKLLEDELAVLSVCMVSSDSLWRKAFLDRFRTDIVKYDPAYRAEVVFGSLEVDIFVSGDDQFFTHLMDLLTMIETKIGIPSNIRGVTNGVNTYVADFEPSIKFAHEDYDDREPLKQWNSQNPIEIQTVYSFNIKKKVSCETVKVSLENALLALIDNMDEARLTVYDNVGDGCVIVGHWFEGSIVVVWDGRESVGVNLLTPQILTKFENSLGWSITARDEMPRGNGKVVNFRDEIGSREEAPHWAMDDDDD